MQKKKTKKQKNSRIPPTPRDPIEIIDSVR